MIRAATLFVVAAVAITSCASDDRGADTTIATESVATSADSTDPNVTTGPGADASTDTADNTAPPVISPQVQAGVDQLTIVDDEAGTEFTVSVGPPGDGDIVATAAADEFGSLVFRDLQEQTKYFLSTDDGVTASPYMTLGREDHPEQDFFDAQALPQPGFGYIETRDGTTLSANVVLPGPPDDGPYPTVVEYSGYSPSNPDESGFKDLFTALGYAYVGVNMRGTGCSGGSFEYFEYVQSLDGYDAVEAIAAQPWVLDNE